MKRILLSLILLCVMHVLWSQEDNQVQNSELTTLLSEEMANNVISRTETLPDETQLSIAIVDGEQITFVGIKKENGKLKLVSNEDKIFEIGSISKVFGAVLLSKQVNENVLSLEDKMFSHLEVNHENASEGSKNITLTMLSNHTSGLPRIPLNMLQVMMLNSGNPYKNYTVDMLKDFYQSGVILDNAPGSTYAYSNLGAGTLGYILSIKANSTFEELLQKEILSPLDMNATSSLLSSIDKNMLVEGRNTEGEITSNWEFTDAMAAAGAIKSSVKDMVKFIKQNMQDDPVYNLTQKTTFTVNENLEVGLGWHISIDGDKRYLWHNGGTGGYKSCMALDKENKKGLIILSNVTAMGSNAQQIDALCFELLKKL